MFAQAALVLLMVLGPCGQVRGIVNAMASVHAWMTLQLMGFEEGPPARTVGPDEEVAALPEAAAETPDETDAVESTTDVQLAASAPQADTENR